MVASSSTSSPEETSRTRPPTPGSIRMAVTRAESKKLIGFRNHHWSISSVKIWNAVAGSAATSTDAVADRSVMPTPSWADVVGSGLRRTCLEERPAMPLEVFGLVRSEAVLMDLLQDLGAVR